MKEPSQEEQVENYLRQGHTLTRLECLNMFHSIELPRIVFDLNVKYPGLIKSEPMKGANGKRFNIYFIEPPPEPIYREERKQLVLF